MGTFKTVLAAMVLAGWLLAGPAAAEDAVARADLGIDYRIGPGDVLDISAWKNPDLSRVVIVLPDGRFDFPLVGQMEAGGKSVADLKEEMVARLKRFVPDPGLTVAVQQVNSMWVYVIGRVNQPGRFQLNGSINVLQALATAGGVNSFAKRDKITVFRERQGATEVFNFDYDEVSAGKNLQQNIVLTRGDVVVVR